MTPVPVTLTSLAPMGVVCSWCDKVIREGIEPISKTICLHCLAAFQRVR